MVDGKKWEVCSLDGVYCPWDGRPLDKKIFWNGL